MNQPLTPAHALPRSRGVLRLRTAAWGVCACAMLLGAQVLAEGVPDEAVFELPAMGGGVGTGARAPLAEVLEALPFL